MASKYTYKRRKAKRCNYGNRRSIKKILYAVVHYTGNDCDSDEGNANYFANNNVGASAHYFIDDDSVTQSVPDDYVAWSVGSTGLLDQGSPYREKGAKYWGKCTNTNSLNFELCDTVKDGKRMVSEKTRANAAVFIAKKMHEHDIPISRLIRHFDVNGKLCPIYWVTDEEDWLKFKGEVNAELKKLKGSYSKGETYTLQYAMNVRTGAGTNYKKKKRTDLTADGKKNAKKGTYAVLKKGTKVTCQKVITLKSGSIWMKIPSGYVCAKDKKKTYIK